MTPRPSSRRGPLAGAALAIVALGLVGAALAHLTWRLARRQLYRVEVAGSSMRPTLAPGDWLLLRRGPPPVSTGAGTGAFGLVVAARDRSGRLLLKRIVGLPGESLRVGTTVQVNGRELREPYASGEAPAASYRGVSRLAANELFLLGDRRDASTDSRELGPFSLAAVEGIVLARYWPPRRLGLLRRPRRRWAAASVATDRFGAHRGSAGG